MPDPSHYWYGPGFASVFAEKIGGSLDSSTTLPTPPAIIDYLSLLHALGLARPDCDYLISILHETFPTPSQRVLAALQWLEQQKVLLPCWPPERVGGILVGPNKRGHYNSDSENLESSTEVPAVTTSRGKAMPNEAMNGCDEYELYKQYEPYDPSFASFGITENYWNSQKKSQAMWRLIGLPATAHTQQKAAEMQIAAPATYLESLNQIPAGNPPKPVEAQGNEVASRHPAAADVAPEMAGLSYRQIALLKFYRNEAVNKNNAAATVAKFGKPAASKLAEKYEAFCSDEKMNTTRSGREAGRLIGDIESIYIYLNQSQKTRAESHTKAINDKKETS